MQQLGKIAHPLTGDVEVDLPSASDSIEMLAAIQRKTDGNLNADEKRLLEHVLYQLRMNYVDVAKEQGEAKTEEAPAGDADGPDAGEAGAAADEPATGAASDEPKTKAAAGEPAAGAVPDTGEEQTG
jgi:DNA replication initiation complex subunit (GINS family)